MDTVYTVAFSGDKFLMVFNKLRGGWEMPGGRIEKGETVRGAAIREFREEAGYSVNIIRTAFLGYCYVCAGEVLDKLDLNPEMRSKFFSSVPKKVSFDPAEYDEVIPWARSIVFGCGCSNKVVWKD
ncbi:MAG: NUDIX domain-containing protein [Candidatus Methanoplasma sp.]|jgi:8-oxo-dGTP diphosphatase|nr:NUDIX domain-containing protein [Candidatus Methanoplasma sp.]